MNLNCWTHGEATREAPDGTPLEQNAPLGPVSGPGWCCPTDALPPSKTHTYTSRPVAPRSRVGHGGAGSTGQAPSHTADHTRPPAQAPSTSLSIDPRHPISAGVTLAHVPIYTHHRAPDRGSCHRPSPGAVPPPR